MAQHPADLKDSGLSGCGLEDRALDWELGDLDLVSDCYRCHCVEPQANCFSSVLSFAVCKRGIMALILLLRL